MYINIFACRVVDLVVPNKMWRYYNREAVVISALQVEKHPITTPGPYTPPPIRNFHAAATAATAVAAFQKTPPSFHRGSSTVGINYSHYNDTISSRNASPVTRPASVASTAPTVSMSMVATHGGGGISCGSPRFEGGFRMSPKPHSSPKMKLRWTLIVCSLFEFFYLSLVEMFLFYY